jgi:hypothetical protein
MDGMMDACEQRCACGRDAGVLVSLVGAGVLVSFRWRGCTRARAVSRGLRPGANADGREIICHVSCVRYVTSLCKGWSFYIGTHLLFVREREFIF